MSEKKAYQIDIDLTKLGKDAKHLIREGRNGNKYITLTMSPRKGKEAPEWNKWQTHNIAAYDKNGDEGKKQIYCGSAETPIWERPNKEEPEELKSIKEQKEEKDDDLPW